MNLGSSSQKTGTLRSTSRSVPPPTAVTTATMSTPSTSSSALRSRTASTPDRAKAATQLMSTTKRMTANQNSVSITMTVTFRARTCRGRSIGDPATGRAAYVRTSRHLVKPWLRTHPGQ